MQISPSQSKPACGLLCRALGHKPVARSGARRPRHLASSHLIRRARLCGSIEKREDDRMNWDSPRPEPRRCRLITPRPGTSLRDRVKNRSTGALRSPMSVPRADVGGETSNEPRPGRRRPCAATRLRPARRACRRAIQAGPRTGRRASGGGASRPSWSPGRRRLLRVVTSPRSRGTPDG